MVLDYDKNRVKMLNGKPVVRNLDVKDRSHTVSLLNKNRTGGSHEIEDSRNIGSSWNSSNSIDNNIGNSKHRKFYHNKFSMLDKGISPCFFI